ncbi:hypothetical protein AB0A74_00050 [Saccharothrix sp. NPDC042600]|uniref:hypothetical protein n=1 Tax=Saccharothrix TaxID=2071 RepID=UPI0033D485AD|nr:hypothetical protein GCM10017745_46770 [Saccharothrix mutabilis subsp. capreolus]
MVTPIGFDTTSGRGAGGTAAVDRLAGLPTTALVLAGLSTDRIRGGFTTRGGATLGGFTTRGGVTLGGFTARGGCAGRCALDREGFGAGGVGLRFDACGGLGGGGFGTALGLGAGFGLAAGLGAGLGVAFGGEAAFGFGTALGLRAGLRLGGGFGLAADLGLAVGLGFGADFGLATGFLAFAGAFLAGAAFFLGACLGLGFAAAGRDVVLPCFGAASASWAPNAPKAKVNNPPEAA